jgi:hypothetical protein
MMSDDRLVVPWRQSNDRKNLDAGSHVAGNAIADLSIIFVVTVIYMNVDIAVNIGSLPWQRATRGPERICRIEGAATHRIAELAGR